MESRQESFQDIKQADMTEDTIENIA